MPVLRPAVKDLLRSTQKSVPISLTHGLQHDRRRMYEMGQIVEAVPVDLVDDIKMTIFVSEPVRINGTSWANVWVSLETMSGEWDSYLNGQNNGSARGVYGPWTVLDVATPTH